MKLEKALFISDDQSPDFNKRLRKPLSDFILDFKPDKIFHLGDLVNFTKISRFEVSNYHVTLKEELETAGKLLDSLMRTAKKANPDVEVWWLMGNHELRLQTYLSKAEQLEGLQVDGEDVISIPHLLKLKQRGIKWRNYKEKYIYRGISLEHGTFVSQKAGQTATKHMERRGRSVIHGHTHRGALVFRRIGDEQQFGMEIGCLCNLNPKPTYSFEPDWINCVGITLYDPVSKKVFPQLIPILNNTFIYNERVYRG